MNALESTLYDLSHLFLAPVLLLILLSLAYAFLSFGAFLWEGCSAGAAATGPSCWPGRPATAAAVTIWNCISSSAWKACASSREPHRCWAWWQP